MPPKTTMDEAAITNKVPVQPSAEPAAPAAPPIALPGGSVGSGWAPGNPLGPRRGTSKAAYARELSVWPAEEEFSGEHEIADSPPPIRGGTTEKSLGTLERRSADVQTAPSASIPPRPVPDDLREEPRLAPPRQGRPRVELSIPTGWSKSVSNADIKRRKAKATPEPKKKAAPTPPPKRGLSSSQFLLIFVVLAILNAPLLIVAGKWVQGFVVEEEVRAELTVEEIVRIELALEARPGDGDDILAEQGLDRHSWSALRGSVTADPSLNAEFHSIRTRLQE